MEVCCGFFGFDAGDAIAEEAEENPFHAPQAHKPKQKHPHGVARHKPAHKKKNCLLYTSPSPRDPKTSRMPSSA